MTGQFSQINPEQCRHYARFMSHLTLTQANAVFWILFTSVLVLMCISSIQHHKSIAITDIEKSLPENVVSSDTQRRRLRKLRLRYLGIVCLCLIISIVCTVIECFALFNIEYCDGEDLMQLYWGFWSVLQVGSLIAILGVAVQFWIVLGNVETPSWAVALGTPVLVFAALGWIFKQIGRRIWYRCTGREYDRDGDSDSDSDDDDDNNTGVAGSEEKGGMDRWLSRAPTVVAEQSDSSPPAGGLLTKSRTASPSLATSTRRNSIS